MRIGIVNDLVTATEALRRVIAGAPQHAVAWTAADGAEAVRRCAEDRPDLILMDLIMPVMGGVEATRRIMAATPCAIVVVTANVEGTSGRVFEASGNVFAIAESWHRGPTAEPVDDPTLIDPIARKLLADARPNADMQGRDRKG